MDGVWLEDIESLEAISQDAEQRRFFLRMAEITQRGRLALFLRELDADADLDATTKDALAELARARGFLHAFEDYLHRTSSLH